MPNHTLRTAVLSYAGRAASLMWLPDHIMLMMSSCTISRHLGMCSAVCRDLATLVSEEGLWLMALEGEGIKKPGEVTLDEARAVYCQYGRDEWLKANKGVSKKESSKGLQLVHHPN